MVGPVLLLPTFDCVSVESELTPDTKQSIHCLNLSRKCDGIEQFCFEQFNFNMQTLSFIDNTSLLLRVSEPFNTAGESRGPAVPANKHAKRKDKH